jgi:hypothetical protein
VQAVAAVVVFVAGDGEPAGRAEGCGVGLGPRGCGVGWYEEGEACGGAARVAQDGPDAAGREVGEVGQDGPGGGAVDLLDVLRRRLTYCCEAFQACHYGALGRDLPKLVLLAQCAADQAGTSAGEAHVLLSRVLQLTASFLHKYGPATAVHAAVVADRALAAAERSGDPVAIGAAARRVAKSLAHQGRPAPAVDFAVAAARRLGDDLTAAGPIGLSTLGMLCLNAAIAASALERSTATVRRATGHVDHAGEVADQQGADLNEDWTAFGPTNVGLHRIDVLTRFEDGWSAREAADELDAEAFGGLARERRARHFITMARAQLLTRRKEDAADSLVEADRLAPEEVRGRKSTVGLVADVVGATPVPSGQLRALAERCGLQA